MNENIDLTKILKNCPIGTKLYLTLCGEVKLTNIENSTYPICVENSYGDRFWITQDGKYISGFDGECILFPSKDQKDWSKFTAPWYKKENKKDRFDPNTLKPFDKVLVKDRYEWSCNFFSHISKGSKSYPYITMDNIGNSFCIPYNDDTKQLIGTTEEAPEYYRYWED